MKEIPLTRGYVAIVDDEDYERLSRFRWQALVTKWGAVYAVRTEEKKTMLMHREVLGLASGDSREVDHRETDKTLDNRRSNLRVVTHLHNMYNRGKNKNNTSGFKGVFWVERKQKWLAQIRAERKQIYIGLFETKEEAAKAYAVAAVKYHGEFAHRSVLCRSEF